MTQAIPRRTLLKGVGTAMALPMLEAMLPLTALAQAGRKSAPVRMAFLFVPNGMNMADWTPREAGSGFALPYILEPLAPMKDSVSILTGLAQQNAFALGDGGGDHARSTAAWLTGCHPRKTDGADIHNGLSVDQLAAQRIGSLTRFPSLEIGCEPGAQAGNCDSGYSCAYSSSVSWRTPTTPVPKEVNPRLVFERLFGSADPTETAESRMRRVRDRRSILDFVMEDARQLRGRLGASDQGKLDEYLSGVREIEERLARFEQFGGAAAVAGMAEPSGIPSEYAAHIRLLADMMVLAFQTDLTRVCTFMLANDGSNRSYREIGVPEGHHDLSHHGRNPDKIARLRQINRFHAEQLAYLLKRLAAVREGDASLLDNCLIVYGAGISDGDRHNHDDLPILLAGRGGGLKSGRHICYPNPTPMTNLFVAMLDRAGVHAETIGDSTGRLQPLF